MPQQQGGGMMSGIMGSIVQGARCFLNPRCDVILVLFGQWKTNNSPTGAAMGTGSAMAHRAVDSMMGPRTVIHENAPAAAPAPMSSSAADACGNHMTAFTQAS